MDQFPNLPSNIGYNPNPFKRNQTAATQGSGVSRPQSTYNGGNRLPSLSHTMNSPATSTQQSTTNSYVPNQFVPSYNQFPNSQGHGMHNPSTNYSPDPFSPFDHNMNPVYTTPPSSFGNPSYSNHNSLQATNLGAYQNGTGPQYNQFAANNLGFNGQAAQVSQLPQQNNQAWFPSQNGNAYKHNQAFVNPNLLTTRKAPPVVATGNRTMQTPAVAKPQVKVDGQSHYNTFNSPYNNPNYNYSGGSNQFATASGTLGSQIPSNTASKLPLNSNTGQSRGQLLKKPLQPTLNHGLSGTIVSNRSSIAPNGNSNAFNGPPATTAPDTSTISTQQASTTAPTTPTANQSKSRRSANKTGPKRGSVRGRIARSEDDEKLVEMRKNNISFKRIKEILNTPLTESTLRGRHRTLTKSREERPRVPNWDQNALYALRDGVVALGSLHTIGLRKDQLKTVPWGKVAQWMVENRGCHLYGNSTVKAKFLEVYGVLPA